MAQAQVGSARVSEDEESQRRASHVLAAHLLLSMCFFLTCLWFSSFVFRGPSGINGALCVQVSKMLRSEPSKATYTGFLKAVLENISLSGPGPQGACFSANSAGEMCAMFHSVLYLTSSFEMLRCNIVHFEWGKCTIVFPFYLCDSLRNVFLKYVF